MANRKKPDFGDAGFVYIMGHFGDMVKIGYTADPEKRLRDVCRMLSMSGHASVRLLAKKKGDRHLENLYHKHFSGRKIEGEWFSDADRLITKQFNDVYATIVAKWSPSILEKRLLESRPDKCVVMEILFRAKAAGSLRRFAKEIGFSVAYLSQVTQGVRETSEKLASVLGYERIVEYRQRSLSRN